MSFDDIMERALDMLRRRGRVSYRGLKRQFDLDNDYLVDLKDEILYTQPNIVEDADQGLICNGTPPELRLPRITW